MTKVFCCLMLHVFLFFFLTAGNKKERQGSEVLTLLLQALQSIVSSEALPAPRALVKHLTLQMAALENELHSTLAANAIYKVLIQEFVDVSKFWNANTPRLLNPHGTLRLENLRLVLIHC